MKAIRPIPKTGKIDDTICLLREGYKYMSNRRSKCHSQIFCTHLLGKKAICISGSHGAKLFYNNNYFTRKKAIPIRIQKTLFGKGGVQTLEELDHQQRKNMFLAIMTEDNINKLVQITKKQWEKDSKKWNEEDSIILHDKAKVILCKAACKWAGIPLKEKEAIEKAMDFYKLVDALGSAGKRYIDGRLARIRLENWMKKRVEQIREQNISFRNNSPANHISWYYDTSGRLLDSQIAAVELINIIRPIVAISTYITFGALAIHNYPKWGKILHKTKDKNLENFAQEVRRFYPFAPYVGAKVKKSFIWRGYLFKRNTLVLLDIYGTNHDSRIWKSPYVFQPERFENMIITPYNFIPQGGGLDQTGHRCPGERITVELLKISLDFLIKSMHYDVPKQDFSYSLTRMPSMVKSGFVIKNCINLQGLKDHWT